MPDAKSILVVDDDETLRMALTAMLNEEGYSASSAVDGEDAINILRSRNFDLILLDLKMPKVDGYGVLKFVKENKPRIKVIMLTGYGQLWNAIESKKLGAEDFVSKPFEYEDLLTTIDRVLSEP